MMYYLFLLVNTVLNILSTASTFLIPERLLIVAQICLQSISVFQHIDMYAH